MCAANDGDMCWKASVDEKQQGEKHVAIRCFHMITRFSRETATNSQTKVRSCSFTVAFLPLENGQSCFLDKQAGKFGISNVWHHRKLRQINHSAFRAVQHTGWRDCGTGWVERMECWRKSLNYRLPRLITPRPIAAALWASNSKLQPFIQHRVFPSAALLWICSLLTSAVLIGSPHNLRDCFSTLFTATDHNAIKGISDTLLAPLTLLQTLCSLATAMPNVNRMMVNCARKKNVKLKIKSGLPLRRKHFDADWWVLFHTGN